MLKPIHLDSLFDSVFNGDTEPTVDALLEAMVKDCAVRAAAEAAMKEEMIDGVVGPTRSQKVRVAVLAALNKDQ